MDEDPLWWEGDYVPPYNKWNEDEDDDDDDDYDPDPEPWDWKEEGF